VSEPSFKDHFSAQAAHYAHSRPSYPSGLAAMLADLAPGPQLALDCGCGNGQLSILLAAHFEQVVATDASAEQIANAITHPRIDYRVAPSETSGLEPGNADLITAAQAAHWFDLPAFYAEVRRVAKPGALLALITYGVFDVEGDAAPILQEFYRSVAGPYWPPERRHVENSYRSLPFPFEPVPLPELAIERQWRRDQLLAYIESWSAVRAMEKEQGREPLKALEASLAALWPDGKTRPVRWPLTVRAGRVS